jgi:hypothetical protein
VISRLLESCDHNSSIYSKITILLTFHKIVAEQVVSSLQKLCWTLVDCCQVGLVIAVYFDDSVQYTANKVLCRLVEYAAD